MVAANNPLEQFRSKTKRLAIHPLEIALLWIVALHLVFLPWAIGGMRPWSQIISLVLAVISFIVALLPRNYTAEHTGGASFRLLPVRKLLKFPIFWLGLAMLALVTTQALNPAWEYHNNGKTWWMQAIPYITWLPHSVRVPFSHWGPWRQLIIYSAAFLTVCAIWVGFTRRRTLQRFFLVFTANGVALSILGFAERIAGNGKLYWYRTSENPSFFSSFVYKNHAATYLILTLAATTGLAAWHYVRGIRHLRKSTPAGLYLVAATATSTAIFSSYARGATLIMFVFIIITTLAFILQLRRLASAPSITISAISLLLFTLGSYITLNALGFHWIWDYISAALSGTDKSVMTRGVIDHASLNFLRDSWTSGAGAGSFEFLFPIYQQHYPSLMTQLWRHAHNDILEIPIELGIPGTLLILTSLGYWNMVFLRNACWRNPVSASIILGLLFIIGISWGDFVFQNPAILITWCALWPTCAIWTQAEQRSRHAECET